MRNKAYLLVEAFIDNLKDAHYSTSTNQMVFNVGRTAKLSKFSGLDLVIRKNTSQRIRLAKRRNKESYAVVIDVKEMPSITELEPFLEKKSIMFHVVEEVEKYMDLLSNTIESSTTSMTDYEKVKHYNSKEEFEKVYQELVKRLSEKKGELDKLVKNFEKQMEETGNPSRKSTLKLAIDKLKSDYLGKTYRDFLKIAFEELNNISPDFKENLDKDNKKILENRLKQFYEEI